MKPKLPQPRTIKRKLSSSDLQRGLKIEVEFPDECYLDEQTWVESQGIVGSITRVSHLLPKKMSISLSGGELTKRLKACGWKGK